MLVLNGHHLICRQSTLCFVCRWPLNCIQSTIVLHMSDSFAGKVLLTLVLCTRALAACVKCAFLGLIFIRLSKECCEWCTNIRVIFLFKSILYHSTQQLEIIYIYLLPDPPLPLTRKLCNAAPFWINSLLLQNCSLYSFYPPLLPPCTYMCMNTCMYTNARRSLNWTFNWKKNPVALRLHEHFIGWFLLFLLISSASTTKCLFLIDLKRLTAWIDWNLWNGLATFAKNEFCFLFRCKMKDACEFCLILMANERCANFVSRMCEFCVPFGCKMKAVCAFMCVQFCVSFWGGVKDVCGFLFVNSAASVDGKRKLCVHCLKKIKLLCGYNVKNDMNDGFDMISCKYIYI